MDHGDTHHALKKSVASTGLPCLNAVKYHANEFHKAVFIKQKHRADEALAQKVYESFGIHKHLFRVAEG